MLPTTLFILFFLCVSSGIHQSEAIRCFVQPNLDELFAELSNNGLSSNVTALFGKMTKMDCPRATGCVSLDECMLPKEAAQFLGDIGKFDIKSCAVNWHSIQQSHRIFATFFPYFFGPIEEYLALEEVNAYDTCKMAKIIFGCKNCRLCTGHFCNKELGLWEERAWIYANAVAGILFGVDVDDMKKLD